MNKLFTGIAAAAAAIALAVPAQAQDIDIDVDFSVNVGYQGSFLKDFNAYPGVTRSLHSGVRAGVDADFEIYEYKGFEFGIRPGVYFSQKGEAYKSNADKALTYDINYLDIPVTLRMQREVVDDLKVIANFGPYFGVGLYGKNLVGQQGTTKHDSFDEKEGELRRFDCGILTSVGLEYEDILFTVGGQYGFVDQLKSPKANGLTGAPKNANFFVMVGYHF